jgi:hypothetical protein
MSLTRNLDADESFVRAKGRIDGLSLPARLRPSINLPFHTSRARVRPP